jgi:hypothetical protein
MRILVVGGRASRWVAEILSREQGRTVEVAGQAGAPPPGDVLGRLEVLEPYDCIVCCPDVPSGFPEKAARHCLERGGTFLQMGAQPDLLERLLLERRRSGAEKVQGTALLGLGLTPGLTNLMAHQLVRQRPGVRRLEIGLRFKGGIGLAPGLLSLMAYPLTPGAAYYSQGDRLDALGIGRGVRFPFTEGESDTVHVPLPESIMLHWSTGVLATATYLALPTPWLPRAVGLGARVAMRTVPQGWSLPSQVHQGLRKVRGALGTLSVPVEVTALADREGVVRCSGDWLSVRVDDHARASAFIVSAALKLLGDGRQRPGIFLPDEVFSFDEVLAQVRGLAGDTLGLVVRSGVPSFAAWPAQAVGAPQGEQQPPVHRAASGG